MSIQQKIAAALAQLGGTAALNHPYEAGDPARCTFYRLQMPASTPTAGLIEGRYPYWVSSTGRGIVAVGRSGRPPLAPLAGAIGAQIGSRAHPSLLLLLGWTAAHRAIPEPPERRELADIMGQFRRHRPQPRRRARLA